MRHFKKAIFVCVFKRNLEFFEILLHSLLSRCGWGSLTLANAKRYPELRFVAFSNSPQQIGFIRSEAEKRSLDNIEAHVEDFADFCSENSVIPVKARHCICFRTSVN